MSRPRICATLLFFIMAAFFLIEYCGCMSEKVKTPIWEGLQSLKDFTTSFPAKVVYSGSQGADALAPKQQEEETLESYFGNPSKELNIPDTTAFFQNIPEKDEAQAIATFGNKMQEGIATNKDGFNIKDFLPQEIHEEWFQTDLSNAKKEVDQASLIDISKFCQGVDTVGQSLKNPSYDIRGNVPNPKIVVSPFLNSSYEPDTNIKSWSS